MRKKNQLPKRNTSNKKYAIKTLKIHCLDCNKIMMRIKDNMLEERRYIKNECPNCHMQAGHFNGTYIIIQNDRRPIVGIKWDKTIDEKNEIIKIREKIAERKKMQEEFYKGMDKLSREELEKQDERERNE